MALNIGSYYGVSRETVNTVNGLARRVRLNIDATIAKDVFGGLYTINRWNAAAIDKVAAAVASRDGKSSKIFAVVGGISAGHFHALNREKVASLVALEKRVTALGY
jgi:hypothetical protein